MTEDNDAPGFVGQVNGVSAKSINTDEVVGQPEFDGLKCISCNELGHTIPVWEDVTEYFDGKPPDYVGCTNCHNMHKATDQIVEDHYNQ